MSEPTKDVIISGGGPVGLFLACELALFKCSVLILEKAENPISPLKQLPFGMRGLSAPSVDALYRRGLLKDFELHKRVKNPHSLPSLKPGQPAPPRQVGHFAGIPFHEENIQFSQWSQRLPSSTPTNLLSEMQEIESILTRRAEQLGVEIKRGVQVTDFLQSDDGVTVHSGSQTFSCKYLIGCDGGRSTIRKLGGFEFAGTEPKFTGYSTQIEIQEPSPLKSGRNLTSKGMYLQSQPGFVIMQDFDGGVFHGSEKPITIEHVQDVLRRVSETDVTIKALHVATTWTDRARQSTQYRNKRILLAGDAAHIHSPLGGQGLNLGLGDAMNLGWKLAATIKNKAPQDLLDTYHLERYPLGMQVLDWSRAQVSIMMPSPEARALNAIVRDLMNTRDGATYFASRVWGVSTHYNLGEGHALLGYSIPNFEFEDGTLLGEHMYDGRGVLLDFSGNSLLKNLAETSSENLKYISGRVRNQLDITAALIRPDGIVAWATNQEPDEREIKESIARWFK